MKTVSKKLKKKKKRLFGLDVDDSKTPYIIFGIVVLLWMSCWLLVSNLMNVAPPESSWSIRGQFGDMFGAVNALFSGLAFAGIIYTILLQREELEAQRKELKATRREFKEQNETFKRQRFENTFFNLLSLHNELIDEIQIGEKTRARGFFKHLNMNLKNAIFQLNYNQNDHESYSKLTNAYWITVNRNDGDTSLNLYYESLYRLLRYSGISDLIQDDEREFYYSIIISNMNSDEKTLLYYHLSLSNIDQVPSAAKLIDLDKHIKRLFTIPYKFHNNTHAGLFEKWAKLTIT